jgi:hypothetical protein
MNLIVPSIIELSLTGRGMVGDLLRVLEQAAILHVCRDTGARQVRLPILVLMPAALARRWIML